MSSIGDRLKSTVKAYNDAIPGLDRFIISKSRKLKLLGSAKGAEAELPEVIKLEARPFSSQELKSLNVSTVDEAAELSRGSFDHLAIAAQIDDCYTNDTSKFRRECEAKES